MDDGYFPETVVREERKTVGGVLDVRYTLCERALSPGDPFGTAYSVRAEVRDMRSGSFEDGSILDITRDRALADQVFDLVSRGGVTPTTLEDVIVDILSDPGY